MKSVRPTIHEAQPGARDQVFDGAGDEDLAGRGARRHPGTDVDRDASDAVVHQFALARVDPGPDLDPERADAVADGTGAADRARWSVEGREEAVPCRLDFSAPMPFEFPPHDPVVLVEKRVPGTVAQRRGPFGRAYDVGEEHGGEHAVDLRHRP